MVLFAETVTEAHTQVIMYGIYQQDIKFMKVGCFDGNRDHLATLEDVEEFLKAEYEKAGLTW